MNHKMERYMMKELLWIIAGLVIVALAPLAVVIVEY